MKPKHTLLIIAAAVMAAAFSPAASAQNLRSVEQRAPEEGDPKNNIVVSAKPGSLQPKIFAIANPTTPDGVTKGEKAMADWAAKIEERHEIVGRDQSLGSNHLIITFWYRAKPGAVMPAEKKK